jgi:glycosyltransferase involved in cell wall biosynthesis
VRVLFVDQYTSLGGGQQCLLDSLEGVLARGWQASVTVPGDGPLVDRIRQKGVEVIPIRSGPYRSGNKRAADFLRYIGDRVSQKRTLRRELGRHSFDLVYANGPRILSACVEAAGGGLPVLYHAHSYLGQSYSVRLVGRSIRRGQVTIAACCHYVAEPLASFVPRGHLHIIPNGVSELAYAPSPKPEVRIGMIGRIAPEKGHLVFVEAAKLLSRELPRVAFVICGSAATSDAPYLSSVGNAAEGLPFEFIPWQESIGRVLGGLTLLVVPSLEEGAPRVILEAFSAGVPVLASAVGGIPEMVEDGKTGFLVPPKSAEELARGILHVLGDTDGMRTVEANARREWERCYDVSIYRNRITNLIESLVSGRQQGSGREPRRPRTE